MDPELIEIFIAREAKDDIGMWTAFRRLVDRIATENGYDPRKPRKHGKAQVGRRGRSAAETDG